MDYGRQKFCEVNELVLGEHGEGIMHPFFQVLTKVQNKYIYMASFCKQQHPGLQL